MKGVEENGRGIGESVWVPDQVLDMVLLLSLARVMTRIVHEVANARPRRSGKNGGGARRRQLLRCAHYGFVVYHVMADQPTHSSAMSLMELVQSMTTMTMMTKLSR